MNPADLLVIAVVAALALFAVWRLRKNKKEGRSGCGCDCGHCPGCGAAKKPGGGQ